MNTNENGYIEETAETETFYEYCYSYTSDDKALKFLWDWSKAANDLHNKVIDSDPTRSYEDALALFQVEMLKKFREELPAFLPQMGLTADAIDKLDLNDIALYLSEKWGRILTDEVGEGSEPLEDE
jgi:hypothetical protein